VNVHNEDNDDDDDDGEELEEEEAEGVDTDSEHQSLKPWFPPVQSRDIIMCLKRGASD